MIIIAKTVGFRKVKNETSNVNFHRNFHRIIPGFIESNSEDGAVVKRSYLRRLDEESIIGSPDFRLDWAGFIKLNYY